MDNITKKLWDSDSASPKKEITIAVPCTHPQDKLNLLLALWSQGLVHFDWIIHCMGGPMNLLRTQVDWRKLGMDFGFCFFARISQDSFHCKNFNWVFIRTETHTVSGHYGTSQGVVLLSKPIFIVVLLLSMISRKHIWISNKWFLFWNHDLRFMNLFIVIFSWL